MDWSTLASARSALAHENRRHPDLRRDPREPGVGLVLSDKRPRAVQAHSEGARDAGRSVGGPVPASDGRLLLRPHTRQDHLVEGYSQYTKINRPSHTTSTKCQYQATASNAKWCSGLKCPARQRARITLSMRAPIVTWNPWNPVSMKNVD